MEALIPAPADCEVRYMIKFLNAQSIAPIEIHRQLCQIYGHTQLGGQHISCRNSVGRCLIIIHPDFAPSDFHIFLHLKKFLFGQRQRLQNAREAEISVTMFQSQSTDLYDTGYNSWSHGTTYVTITEVNMLEK